jgi:hypothetical protein
VQRITDSEPVTESSDPLDSWEDDPVEPPATSRLIRTAGVTGDPLPPPGGHVEPGDPSEAEAEAWAVVAEVDNATPVGSAQPGRAVVLDADVITEGVYRYRAVALIGADSSPPSNVERVERTGGQATRSGIRTARRVTPDHIEIEASVAGRSEIGVTIELDIPAAGYEVLVPGGADGDWAAELTREVAIRQVANAQQRSRVTAVVGVPLQGLDYGQRVRLEACDWQTTGGGATIHNQVDYAAVYSVAEWTLSARRTEDGGLQGAGITTVELDECI